MSPALRGALERLSETGQVGALRGSSLMDSRRDRVDEPVLTCQRWPNIRFTPKELRTRLEVKFM